MNKKSKTLILISLIVVLAIAVSAKVSNKDDCDINPNTASWEDWEQCDGKNIEVTGTITRNPWQHPIGLHDSLDPQNNEFNEKIETYLDLTQDIQIVVTSDEKIQCDKKVKIKGVIDIIILGGSEGTRDSYKNIWLKAEEYSCS